MQQSNSNALNAYLGGVASNSVMAGQAAMYDQQRMCYVEPDRSPAKIIQTSGSKKVDNKELLPDISLARVIKWGIVLLIAMGLGKKVWAMFGDKLTAKLHTALDTSAV